MKIDEANRIIAEYMGWYRTENQSGEFWQNRQTSITRDYLDYESLDALVPVWGKLGIFEFRGIFEVQSCFLKLFTLNSEIGKNPQFIMIEEGETIQQAAAIATAKIIQRIGERG